MNFEPLATLSEIPEPINNTIFKIWQKSLNRVSLTEVIQRFIDYNREYFSYLGIQAEIRSKSEPQLYLSTSSFIGTIPLRSATSGKIFSTLSIQGRYGERPQELMSVLDGKIHPEYNSEWSITESSPIVPPIFMECCDYIDAYLEAEKIAWRKFTSSTIKSRKPSTSTLWDEYSLRSAVKPATASTFYNRENYLTREHPEQQMLNYVAEIAIEKLNQPQAPASSRILYSQRCARVRRLLTNRISRPTLSIPQHGSDPVIVRRLKELSKAIIEEQGNARYAWRMDYTKFFELFVQHLFTEAANKIGGKTICNPHFSISGYRKAAWSLAYLEPDLIVEQGSRKIVVDAKYKSHIYNLKESTDNLRTTFRHDLHQVLAYSSFTEADITKAAMLVYPAPSFRQYEMKISGSPTNQGRLESAIKIIGVPISVDTLPKTIEQIADLLRGVG